MAGDNSLTVDLTPETKAALARQVKAFTPKLKAELKEKLEHLGGEAADAIRQAILASQGGGGRQWKGHPHQSRSDAASAIGSTPTSKDGAVGSSVGLQDSGLAPARQAFPFVLNKSMTSHPVYGSKTAHWVNQQGNPYIEKIMQQFKESAEKEVTAALAEAAETVKGSKS